MADEFFFRQQTKDPEEEDEENKELEIEKEVHEERVIDQKEVSEAAAIATATALPGVDLSIAGKGLTETHFVVLDRRALNKAQSRDTKLQLLCLSR